MAPSPWFVFLFLIILSLLGIVAQVLYTILSRRRQRASRDQYVSATVTKVEEESNGYHTLWYVTAVWKDEANRLYTFRSPPLARRPKVHQGEAIFVRIITRRPLHYDMLL